MEMVKKEKQRRKLIQAPRFNIFNETEDDDDLSDIPPCSPWISHMPQLPSTNTVYSTNTSSSWDSTPTDINSLHFPHPDSPPTSPWGRFTFELANYGKSSTPKRRHSITLFETPQQSSNSVSIVFSPPSSSCNSNATSAPSSPAYGDIFCSMSQTHRDILSLPHFSNRLDCLALTLKEVVHIRNVLTKADLEALPLDLSIKEDMAKGKVCFLCMKVRFSFLGPRGYDCRLCRRVVCKRCISKIHIPIQMLTPHALSPCDDDEDLTLGRSILSRLTELPYGITGPGSVPGIDSGHRRICITNSVGSAPSSSIMTGSSADEPTSLPTEHQPPAPYVSEAIKKLHRSFSTALPDGYSHQIMIEKQKQRSQSVREDHQHSELMNVCGDCKPMVLHYLASITLRISICNQFIINQPCGDLIPCNANRF